MMTNSTDGRQRYTVIAERDGRFWFLRVMGRPELATQSLRLDQAEAMVRDLIATWDQVPEDAFDVRVETFLDANLDDAVDRLRFERAKLADAEQNVAALTKAVAQELVDHGLTFRDAGRILELSHQRIAQLVADPEPKSSLIDLMAALEASIASAEASRAKDSPTEAEPARSRAKTA